MSAHPELKEVVAALKRVNKEKEREFTLLDAHGCETVRKIEEEDDYSEKTRADLTSLVLTAFLKGAILREEAIECIFKIGRTETHATTYDALAGKKH